MNFYCYKGRREVFQRLADSGDLSESFKSMENFCY